MDRATQRKECPYRLAVERPLFHPGGTCLRIETIDPTDRCALKPRRDNFGRLHNPVRWVLSGGSPITVAEACDGVCPSQAADNDY